MPDSTKPVNPPKKKDDGKSSGDKRKDGDDKAKSSGGSLDWLVEAANYEPKRQPPKKSGDWMADGGKIV